MFNFENEKINMFNFENEKIFLAKNSRFLNKNARFLTHIYSIYFGPCQATGRRYDFYFIVLLLKIMLFIKVHTNLEKVLKLDNVENLFQEKKI